MEEDCGEEGYTRACTYGREGSPKGPRAVGGVCYELPKIPGVRRVYAARPGKKQRLLLDGGDSLVEDQDRMSDSGGEKEQASAPTRAAPETIMAWGETEFSYDDYDEEMQDRDGLYGRSVGNDSPEYGSFAKIMSPTGQRGHVTDAELSDRATAWHTALVDESLCYTSD